MNEILDNIYFFALFDSERHLSSFHSVTMHRISSTDVAEPRHSKRICSALNNCNIAPSLKDEICLPIIKNRLKTNF